MAGDDVSVTKGYDGFASTTLDGSASSDPDGDPLSFTWSLDGQLVTTAPSTVLARTPGTYVATLLWSMMIAVARTPTSDSDIIALVWSLDGEVLSTEPTFTVALPAGQHVLALSVLDRRGGTPKNRPPMAAASPPSLTWAGTGCRANITHDGCASSDPDFAVPQRS